MKIPSVSTGTGVYPSTRNNSEIKMLEKQKEQLEKQVQTTKESEMDSKTKQQVIKDLQSQIQQIESQIQQKRNENLTQNTAKDEKDQERSKTDNPAGQGTDDLSNLSSLVEASSSYTRARALNSVKSSMEGRSGILEQEIKLDEAKGIDPKAKKEELSDVKQRSSQLDKDLGETLKTSEDKAQDGVKTADSDNQDNETKEDIEKKDNDSLTWLLEHNGQYNPLDILT